MSLETKKRKIVGDTSFTDTLFHMAERLDVKGECQTRPIPRQTDGTGRDQR